MSNVLQKVFSPFRSAVLDELQKRGSILKSEAFFPRVSVLFWCLNVHVLLVKTAAEGTKTAVWLSVETLLPAWLAGPSVLFAPLGVELEQQPEGGEAEQEGLREPHAAGGCAVNALVPVEGSRSQCCVTSQCHLVDNKVLCWPAVDETSNKVLQYFNHLVLIQW